jgi:DNA-directed RNA polymerase subunit RPC12/RpoP
MEGRCPGRDIGKLTAAVYKCPNCGAEVEIFSDESKFKCRKCGTMVFKEKTPSCIEWCASAKQCLGEETWQRLMSQGKPATDK